MMVLREKDLLSYISNHRVMHAQSLELLHRKHKIHLKWMQLSSLISNNTSPSVGDVAAVVVSTNMSKLKTNSINSQK